MDKSWTGQYQIPIGYNRLGGLLPFGKKVAFLQKDSDKN